MLTVQLSEDATIQQIFHAMKPLDPVAGRVEWVL